MYLTRVQKRADVKAGWFNAGQPKMRQFKTIQKITEKASPTIRAWLKLNKTKKKRLFIMWQRKSKREAEPKKRSCELGHFEKNRDLELRQAAGKRSYREVENIVME